MKETSDRVASILNKLGTDALRETLEKCCGAKAWVDAMARHVPFMDDAELHHRADVEWNALGREDWLEAFGHHPRIGDVEGLRKKFASTAHWAQNEQSSVAHADEETLTQLAQLNVDYEAKFGFIFIVCATGKSAAEMLSLLKQRIGNNKEVELRTAAAEQIKITHLRLDKVQGT